MYNVSLCGGIFDGVWILFFSEDGENHVNVLVYEEKSQQKFMFYLLAHIVSIPIIWHMFHCKIQKTLNLIIHSFLFQNTSKYGHICHNNNQIHSTYFKLSKEKKMFKKQARNIRLVAYFDTVFDYKYFFAWCFFIAELCCDSAMIANRVTSVKYCTHFSYAISVESLRMWIYIK